MAWIARKFDSLVGAVFGGVAGAGASQFEVFVQQYLQRLGGHFDEAKRHLDLITEGERYREMTAEMRTVLLSDAQARMSELDLAYRSLAEADILHRPWVFMNSFDSEIAARTLDLFRPALPIDLAGLVYAACGMVLGLIVYEILKAPFALAFGRRRRQRSY